MMDWNSKTSDKIKKELYEAVFCRSSKNKGAMDKKEIKVSSKLKNHLFIIGENEKFKKIFSMKDRPLKEKFSEIWEREDLRNVIKLVAPKELYNRKDDKLSKEFVVNGNRLYNNKKYENALLSLNFAILSGKNPKLESTPQSKPENIKPILKGYEKRSLLLYKLGKFQECIRDIDIAIELGYSSEKVGVLQQRKVDSLLKLKKNKDAEKIVKMLLENEKSSQNQNSVADLQELLKKCRIKETSTQESSKEVPRKIDIFERGLEYPLFIKKYRKDKDINVISDSVKIHYTPQRGRHLVATKDIEPGEILLAERSYSNVILSKDKLRSFCCVCLRKVVIVLPCDTCSLACYCSEECIASKHNIHPIECPVLTLLLESNVAEEAALVFRTLLKFNMEEILSEVSKPEKARSTSESTLKDARLFVNMPMSYPALTKLEGHVDKRSGESILESIANAVLVVKLLQKIPKFWEMKESEENLEQNTENLITLGGEVLKLLLNFQCNIHCIKELCIDRKSNILNIDCSPVGYGIYKNFSMTNHSCSPNSLNSNWGDVKFLYSISFIPKGAEISDSYGERYVSHPFEMRKENLKETYYFECDCEACVNGWPLFSELSSAYNWICPVCKIVLNQTTFKCDNCQNVSSKDPPKDEVKPSEIYNSRRLKEDFKTALENYRIATNNMNAYKPSLENIKYISVYLSLLSKYTKIPNKPIVEAQETMMRANDLLGSFSYKDLSFLKF